MRTQFDVSRAPVGASQKVDYDGSVQSTAFPGNTNLVRLVSTTDCFVELGENPTAAANTSMFLPAYSPEYIVANPAWKVAAIKLTSAGTLYVTPVN